MKRIGNLFDKIISLDNLKLADLKARRGKYGKGVGRRPEWKSLSLMSIVIFFLSHFIIILSIIHS